MRLCCVAGISTTSGRNKWCEHNMRDQISTILICKLGCPVSFGPAHRLTNHHTLVFFRTTKVEKTLEDDVLDALVRAMTIVKNLHRKQ